MAEDQIGRRKSKFQVVFEGIVSLRWFILATVIVVLVASYFEVLPSIPSLNLWQGVSKSVILGFVFGIMFLYLPTVKVFKKINKKQSHWLFVINSSKEDKPIDIHRIGTKKFEDMTVEGKKLKQFTMADGNNGYLAIDYNPEENKAENNWMAEVDERELITAYEKIREHRIKNMRWARIGRKLYSRFDKVVEQIEANFWKEKTDQLRESSDIMSKEIKQEVFEDIEELEEIDRDSEATESVENIEETEKSESEAEEESDNNEQ